MRRHYQQPNTDEASSSKHIVTAEEISHLEHPYSSESTKNQIRMDSIKKMKLTTLPNLNAQQV